MTHAEQILHAVAVLITQEGQETFTRNDVRCQLGVDPEVWLESYTATFQAMRVDQPGGAPAISDTYRGMFKRVARGIYVLTPRGREWLKAKG